MHFPDEIILPKAIFLTWNVDKGCHGFRSNRGRDMRTQRSWVFAISPACSCEGESQTTGKLCVLHFFYKGQLNIASLCNGRTKRKWDATLNLESGDRIE